MDRSDRIIATIALQLIPGIGRAYAKRLIERAGSAEQVFANKEMFREEFISGSADESVERMLSCPEAMEHAKREYEFAVKNNIRCLTADDEDYPSRLRECDDAPMLLFFKGNTNLNPVRSIAMVGTRHITDYGRTICDRFIRELREICPDVLIISGLAYGVDIHSHRAALANGMATIGVLAHGLDRIYPQANRQTAVDMLKNGGLITEFTTGIFPDKYNFVSRNRIVAGMADATIVVESASKGGSLITADIASSYHRDCFAFPGRVYDEYSAGCNNLIIENKAALLTSAEEFAKAMCWITDGDVRPKAVQRDLFPDLTPEEQRVVDVLRTRDELQINTLVVECNIPINRMSTTLFDLEMKGVVRVLAGGMYKLI
jgi:DNA processing protein